MHLQSRLLAALAVTVGLVLAGLTACSAPPPVEPAGVAVVVGAHANQPQYPAAALAGILGGAVDEGATLAVVTDEGAPRLVYKATVGDLATNPATRAEQLDGVRTSLAEALDTAAAVTPESNPLEAIAQAAEALRDVPGPRRIIVTSALLQTTGALDFTTGLLLAEPADVVEALGDALPALSGIQVDLLAAGQTMPPQEPLDAQTRTRLAGIWTAVLTAAGAHVTLGSTQVGAVPSPELPDVTPVDVAPPGPLLAAECRVVVNDARVSFAPNSADFVDASAAQAVIADVAGQLAACEGTVRVLGTTSSAGDEEGRARVSSARANAVAALLAQALGRDAATFDVRGLGYDTGEGECVEDRVDGRLVEELMVLNRKTLIIVD